MIQKNLFLLTFLCLTISLFAKNKFQYAITNIDESLLENAHTVIRLEETNFIVSAPNKAIEKGTKVISVINKKSYKDYVVIGYDMHRKVKKFSCTIYDKHGKEIKSYKLKDLNDQAAVSEGTLYSDNRLKFLDLTHIPKPFTIEYSFEIVYSSIFSYPNWEQSYQTSVEKSIFSITTPKNIDLHYKTFNIDLNPEISTSDITRHTWRIQNLSAIKKQSNSPPSHRILAQLLVMPSVFQIDDFTGSYSSWKDYGAFIYKINEGRDVLSAQMAEKVKELTATTTNDREKIQVLYQYVQDNMRYVSVQLGIGGWQAYDAKYVERNKYGDCKALSNFTKSLLKEAGIESHLAVIIRGDLYMNHSEDFANPYFNHMILRVPSEDCWLECTSNTYPINYLGENNEDRYALLLTEDGGILERTPNVSSSAHTKASIKIDTEGYAQIVSSMTVEGSFQDGLREFGTQYTEEEKKKFLHHYSSLPSFEIEEVSITKDEFAPRASLDYQLKVKNYASKAGKRMFIPLNSINAFTTIPKTHKDRKQAIYVGNAYTDINSFTLTLPDDFEVESLPENEVEFSSEFGIYRSTLQLTGNQLTFERSITIHSIDLPAERYDEFRSFYKKMAKADQAQLVLKKIDRP